MINCNFVLASTNKKYEFLHKKIKKKICIKHNLDMTICPNFTLEELNSEEAVFDYFQKLKSEIKRLMEKYEISSSEVVLKEEYDEKEKKRRSKILFLYNQNTICYDFFYENEKAKTILSNYNFGKTIILTKNIENLTTEDIFKIFKMERNKEERIIYVKDKELLPIFNEVKDEINFWTDQIIYIKNNFYQLRHNDYFAFFSDFKEEVVGITEEVKNILQSNIDSFIFDFNYYLSYNSKNDCFFFRCSENNKIYFVRNRLIEFFKMNNFSIEEFIQKNKIVSKSNGHYLCEMNGSYFMFHYATKRINKTDLNIKKIQYNYYFSVHFPNLEFYTIDEKTISCMSSPLEEYHKKTHVLLEEKQILAYEDLILRYITLDKNKILLIQDYQKNKEYYYKLNKNDTLSENNILLNMDFEKEKIYQYLRKKIEENKEKIESDTEDFITMFSFY